MSRYALVGVALVTLCGAVDSGVASVVYKDVAALTTEASQIVIGDVVDVTSFWDENHALIRSRITVRVTDYLLGSGSGLEVMEMSGGTVDGLRLEVSVLPTFETGDHVLLFLKADGIRLVEAFQGAYLTDGQDIVGMSPLCRRVIETSRRPLTAFLAEVQAALPPGTALGKVSPYTGGFQLPVGGPRYDLCDKSWAWQSSPMTPGYFINPSCMDPSAGGPAMQISRIENAMIEWNDAGANFSFRFLGAFGWNVVALDPWNMIFFSQDPPDNTHGEYVAANYKWYDPDNAGAIIHSDIVFDDRDWVFWDGSGTCNNMDDIWSVAAHELGHTLCLADLDGSDTDKVMSLYSGACEINKRILSDDDRAGIIAIYGHSNAPDNDYCHNAVSVAENNAYTGTLIDAGNDGSADCGSSTTSPDVWYEYSATADGVLTVDTCTAATFDAVLSIHSGCPGTTANQLGCSDAGCAGGQATVSAAFTSGLTYYIRVAGNTGATGTFTLNVTFGDAAATPPVPNPMTFEVAPRINPTLPYTALDMLAASATDATGGVVYAFEADQGPAYPGATSRGWAADRDYTDSGLVPNTRYTYRVKAKDALGNTTIASPDATAATAIEGPTAVSFGTVGDISMTLLASGTFTNLSRGSSGIYFDSTTPGGDGGINRWVQTTTDVVQGLTPNTTYVFRAKARNQDGVETAYSPAGTRTTMIESRGVTAESATTDSVEIRVDGPLTNLGVGSSAVYFDSTTEGVSADIRTWTQATFATVTGLTPGTRHAFRLKARNRDAVETPYSESASICTLANVPGMPVLTGVTAGTLDLEIDAKGNSAETEFAVQCITTVPLDAVWVGRYVDSAGLPADIAAWRTAAGWAATTVGNLKRATSYTLVVKARNPAGVETVFGAPATAQTSSAGGPTSGSTGQACGAGAGCSSGVLLMVPSVLIGLGWIRRRHRRSGRPAARAK